MSQDMKRMAEKMRRYVATLATIIAGDGDASLVPGDPAPPAPEPSPRAARRETRPLTTKRPQAIGSPREVNPGQILPLDNDDFEDF
jgi:hypothetical protein